MSSGNHSHHVIPVKVYAAIFGALLVLTYITVQVSYFNFGVLNIAVAVVVATIKAMLVCLYFMHLRYDTVFNRIVFFSTAIFLALFMGLALLDSGARLPVKPSQFADNSPVPVDRTAEAAAPGAQPAVGGAEAPKSATPENKH
ncbi:MAG: cytochrome C oxidase subunit IV family protein [Blastocatellia bacterium]|nr:cytochrome C oxidase subunit IV family protein [Blastocatellia bacterium]